MCVVSYFQQMEDFSGCANGDFGDATDNNSLRRILAELKVFRTRAQEIFYGFVVDFNVTCSDWNILRETRLFVISEDVIHRSFHNSRLFTIAYHAAEVAHRVFKDIILEYKMYSWYFRREKKQREFNNSIFRISRVSFSSSSRPVGKDRPIESFKDTAD